MNLQKNSVRDVNLRVFITTRTKQRNVASCESCEHQLFSIKKKKSSVTHIPRVFVKKLHQSSQTFEELFF
jgi:hypothetical protein